MPDRCFPKRESQWKRGNKRGQQLMVKRKIHQVAMPKNQRAEEKDTTKKRFRGGRGREQMLRLGRKRTANLQTRLLSPSSETGKTAEDSGPQLRETRTNEVQRVPQL